MGHDSGDVEILVHITAPSRGKDDQHYRALSTAYLDFEPLRRLSLTDDGGGESTRGPDGEVVEDDEQAAAAAAASQLHEELHSFTRDARDDHDTEKSLQHEAGAGSSLPQQRGGTRSESIQAVIDSPQASFRNILDNLDSPSIRMTRFQTWHMTGQISTGHSEAPQENSWHTPPAVILDSQATHNRAIPAFTSPTRVLELYLQHFTSSGESISPSNPNAEVVVQVVGSDTSPLASSVVVGSQSTDIVLASSPKTHVDYQDKGKEPDRPQPRALVNGTSDLAERSVSSGQSSSLKRKLPQEDPVSSSPTRIMDSFTSPTSSSPILISSAEHEHEQEREYHDQTPPLPAGTHHQQQQLSKMATEIHPPPPPVSTEDLTPSHPTILTDYLVLISQQLRIEKRYRPATQTRPLRALERGYWSVCVDSWPESLRFRAWRFLKGYVSEGKAGWGIWVARSINSCDGEIDGAEVAKAKSAEVLNDISSGGAVENPIATATRDHHKEEWRVYCWADVIGHIYLLLHLMSERQIKGRGATWIDGSGEVVVTMPLDP